jgi:hypothetical protein
VPEVRKEKPETDPDLAETITSMMTKDRTVRPTFDEAARKLARIAARLNGELPRVTRQLFMVSARSVTASSSIEDFVPPKPRVWPRIAALAVIVAAVIGLAIVFGR